MNQKTQLKWSGCNDPFISEVAGPATEVPNAPTPVPVPASVPVPTPGPDPEGPDDPAPEPPEDNSPPKFPVELKAPSFELYPNSDRPWLLLLRP